MQEGSNEQFENLCRSILRNINAALSVGGPERDDGNAGRLRDSHIHRSTQISRSTLRLIRKNDQSKILNPDLRTLYKISELIGIPLPFLIMAPEDWSILINAVGDMKYMADSANKSIRDQRPSPSSVKRVLESGKMLNIPPPYGITDNLKEIERLNKVNESRRRVSHVMGSLISIRSSLLNTPSQTQEIALISLAAAITNQINERNKKYDLHP